MRLLLNLLNTWRATIFKRRKYLQVYVEKLCKKLQYKNFLPTQLQKKWTMLDCLFGRLLIHSFLINSSTKLYNEIIIKRILLINIHTSHFYLVFSVCDWLNDNAFYHIKYFKLHSWFIVNCFQLRFTAVIQIQFRVLVSIYILIINITKAIIVITLRHTCIHTCTQTYKHNVC